MNKSKINGLLKFLLCILLCFAGRSIGITFRIESIGATVHLGYVFVLLTSFLLPYIEAMVCSSLGFILFYLIHGLEINIAECIFLPVLVVSVVIYVYDFLTESRKLKFSISVTVSVLTAMLIYFLASHLYFNNILFPSLNLSNSLFDAFNSLYTVTSLLIVSISVIFSSGIYFMITLLTNKKNKKNSME